MQFFLFLHLNFCNVYPQKVQILTIFSKKRCNFEQFSTSESDKYGEIISLAWEKIDFLQNINLWRQVCEAVSTISEVAQGNSPRVDNSGAGELSSALDHFDNRVIINPVSFEDRLVR